MRVPAPLAFAACAVIWGTTWLAIKVGYTGLDALWAASLRFFLAAALLLPYAMARPGTLPRGPRQVAVAAAVGLLLFGLDYGLIYWGEQALSSGLTAILFATMPLLVALAAPLIVPTERVGPRHIAGVLASLVGLVLIFANGLSAGPESWLPMAAIVVAAAAAAVSSLVVRRRGTDLSPVGLNASAMLVGATALLAASLASGEHPAAPATGAAWGAVLYLTVLGSVVSFFLYWSLLRQWEAHRASLIPVLTPLVAVATGLLVGERLTPTQWVGGAAVLAGVAFALTRRLAPRVPHAPQPAATR